MAKEFNKINVTSSMVRPQNKSQAVMAQRFDGRSSPDDFPTPPWATRGLIEHIISDTKSLSNMSCLEPACGCGHMSKVLTEYFSNVCSSDAYDYQYGQVRDYLLEPYNDASFDWVITNPPFRLAEEFIIRSLSVAKVGVAILARTVFIESVGRYEYLFKNNPPSKFAQFCERVPMVKGRLDQKASTATGYAWLVWEKNYTSDPKLMWIPPCRKYLERTTDYLSPPQIL